MGCEGLLLGDHSLILRMDIFTRGEEKLNFDTPNDISRNSLNQVWNASLE